MITLINPNLIVQKNDIFTTGIVYMPVGLACFAAALKKNGLECSVIDAFGERPNQVREEEHFIIRGLYPDEVVQKIPAGAKVVVVYAISSNSHYSVARIISLIHAKRPSVKIVVMENSQAVTAYALCHIQEELYDLGADYCLTGEPERRGVDLFKALEQSADKNVIGKIDGIGFRENGTTHYSFPSENISDLDSLSFPDWEMFPLKNYWDLRYSHGPLETGKYLPLLTSRGCPYRCGFCVIPGTNDCKWRARSAINVADEIEKWRNQFKVTEFHIEDVNPTIDNSRTVEICSEIIKRGLKIIWKIAAGTKIETIRDEQTIELMAKAGCRYISISPESASPKILEAINKSFDKEHAIRMIKQMNKSGIYSQACFVLGYPGETDEDRMMTWEFARKLTKTGIDEIAIFIITPMPGSGIFDKFSGYADYSQLNFSPSWREDYKALNAFRLSLYRHFLLWKLLYHPIKLFKQPLRFILRHFKTKMEMTPYRALHTAILKRKAKKAGKQK